MLGEFSNEQRLEEFLISLGAHPAAHPGVGGDALKGLPARRELDGHSGQAHAQGGHQREGQEDRRGRNLAAHRRPVNPVARFGAREDDLVAHAHLLGQAQNIVVGGEPVMIEFLQRPIPAFVFEAGRQAADAVRRFVDGD